MIKNGSNIKLKLKSNNSKELGNNILEHNKSKKKMKLKMPELKQKSKGGSNISNNKLNIKINKINGKSNSNFGFKSSTIYNKSIILDPKINQTNDPFIYKHYSSNDNDYISNLNFNLKKDLKNSTASEIKTKLKLSKFSPIFDKNTEKGIIFNKENKQLKFPIINNNNNINNNYDFQTKMPANISENNSKIFNSEIGFCNLGNTCFMNTCLQNLIHSEYFIKNLFSKINLVSKNTPITYQFINLCLEIIENKNKGTKVISPKNFKEIFSKKHRQFKGFRQHDAQEFCRIFLEDINQELNEIKVKPPYKELSTLNKTKIECEKEFDDNFKGREKSIILECFYSQIINIFICKCGFETYSFQKVLDFPLLLKKDCKKIELENLLKMYFETEKIPFETKCENCKKKQVHKKEIKFSQTPNILILSLQRRNERTGKKNNCLLKFPEILDISDYIDEDFRNKNESKYMLYGVGNHVGDFDFGHYFAYIKLNGDKWYEFNDSTVCPYSNFIGNSSSAYILFYKKFN